MYISRTARPSFVFWYFVDCKVDMQWWIQGVSLVSTETPFKLALIFIIQSCITSTTVQNVLLDLYLVTSSLNTAAEDLMNVIISASTYTINPSTVAFVLRQQLVTVYCADH